MKIYNTLTRQKENFEPIQKGKVGLYSCGPTVYNHLTIGNLRTYLMSDLLVRVLRLNGYDVNQVMNITDVGHLTKEETDSGEDKMEKAATKEGKTPEEIASFYTKSFQTDFETLNILPPSKYLKATDHINQQIALIEKLLEKGFAYETDSEVYFDTSKLSDYGKLAKLNIEGLEAGARVEVGQKKNPTDFALWKKTVGENANHIQRWPSPWGEGFPGWHIECSAMSAKYLGQPFDIHTGGIDHIPVHHTNEIAQSEAAEGNPLANYWVHGEFLVIGDNERMGKSLGNFITLQSLVDSGIDPIAYRYWCLTVHYRQKLAYSEDALKAAETALSRLRQTYQSIPTEAETGVTEIEEQIKEALSDDLDAPKAVALIWEMVRNGNYNEGQVKKTLTWFNDLLSLELDKEVTVEVTTEAQKLIDEREEARTNNDWETADNLRNELEKLGYTIKDTDKGPIVGKK